MRNAFYKEKYLNARKRQNCSNLKFVACRLPAKTYAKKTSFPRKSWKNPTGHWRRAIESTTSSHVPINNSLKTKSNSPTKYLISRVASSSCRIKIVHILLAMTLSCNAIASWTKEIASSARWSTRPSRSRLKPIRPTSSNRWRSTQAKSCSRSKRSKSSSHADAEKRHPRNTPN